ncbi:leucine-rich repeat domain-containing protein [Pedobacter caeni]|uniref:Leucine-rich repeat (LRR) protein n=1 Tax=Pedobacter caeni TaxID=288992 RepID=A0A1M5GML4_9SPHI|nr:hypothetical protein [Pedobacter caeni]SHG04791.1 Leucine-rich repeat (LRR) protein [Pedobacter caeni]
MPNLKYTFFVILISCLFACKKDEKTEIKPALPFAAAGTNQNDVENFQVTLNADSLKAGQTGKWTIEKGLVESKVYFSSDVKPDSKFNGMPGETYQLKWTVMANGTKYSESTVQVIFKPLKAVIGNNAPGNSTQFFLTGNKYDNGLWTIEGKYAKLLGLIAGGTVVPDINSPYVQFQGYANTSYKITWTTYYGSKSASATWEFKTGNYLEKEALYDLQLDPSSYRLAYENGHIVKLDLNASAAAWILRDTLQFPALQALTHLRFLDLQGSSVGEFPKIIGDKFRQLETLNFTSTKISSIPENIGMLSKLKQLILGYGGGIYSLPESFGDLESLEYFKCTAIGLEYIPESFSKLKKLKYLEANLNPIQRLPSKIGDLSNLEVLLVSTAENIPASISKLRNLRRMYFTTKTENSVLPDDFGSLSALDTLIMEGKYKELPSTFGNLDLKDFQLTGPALTALPYNFGNLKNLENLIIAGQFKSLPVSFTKLMKLKYCTLYSNELETLPADLGNLRRLVYLHVEYGKIKTVPESIGDLENLNEIRLDKNQIEELPAGFFNLPKITIIKMSTNKLKSLSDDFGKLSATLKTLYLYNNAYPPADGIRIKQLLPTTTVYVN